MIACVDVDYGETQVTTACLGFTAWTDAESCHEAVAISPGPAAGYAPGAFFQRELPYLLAVLQPLASQLDAVVVDGYVWLAADRPGLGAHLAAQLTPAVPVIGVAKSAFPNAPAICVTRGPGARPLHITALGIDPAIAARRVVEMHGAFRMPTLLKRVDQLARGLVRPRSGMPASGSPGV